MAGDRVYFMLRRDAALTTSSTEVLQRGIYVVDADGGNLRQLVGPEQIAKLLGIAPHTVGMLRLQTYALDVSADGEHVIFGANVGPEAAVFLYDDDARELGLLRGSLAYVQRVAMSGDGATVAYIVGVGLIALQDGVLDVNVANGVLLHDDGQNGDGQNGDATPNDGLFTADNIVHTTYEARENDAGPQVIQIAAEVKNSNGRRHATAVDIGQLMVGSVSMRGGTPAAETSMPSVWRATKPDLAVVR